MNDGRKLLTGRGSIYSLTQQSPGAAGLVIDEFVPFRSEGQLLTVQLRIEDSGSSDLPGIADQQLKLLLTRLPAPALPCSGLWDRQ